MKENTNIDINTIKLLYKKYKEHLVYILVIFTTFLLLLFTVLPRIKDLAKLNNERKIELNKISVLKNNLYLLSNLDDSLLNFQLSVASSALPSEKDFEGVLNAVSLASAKSGVSLNDYEFQVGNLSQGLSDQTTGFPSLILAISIRGTPSQVVRFVGSLSRSMPLSEIVSISQNADNAAISVIFYYKTQSPIRLNDSEKIAPLSEKGRGIISTLSSWRAGSLSQPEASASGASSASPF